LGGAAAIEQHSAVWRFNLDTPSGSEDFVGNTTTVRVVNQGASNKMNDPKGKTNKKWHPGEREVSQPGSLQVPVSSVCHHVNSNVGLETWL